jgi:hypothetical protein
MNIDQARIITADATKGANLKVSWERSCKTRKKLVGSKIPLTDVVTKAVDAVCRIGIDYDNIKDVQAKRASGELPTENQGIWHGKGEWVDFPYIVRHTGTNKLYFRLYYGSGASADKSKKAQFKLNGEPCRMEDVSDMLMANEKSEKSGDCFYVKLEDVKSIAWGSMPEVNREPIKTGAEENEAVEEIA